MQDIAMNMVNTLIKAVAIQSLEWTTRLFTIEGSVLLKHSGASL